jgi:hypothetical protein
MVEIADIFRDHGPAYLEKYRDRMPPSHIKVMKAIIECRTEVLGGHVYHCEKCECEHYSYHSCKNRHCPKCQHNDNEGWLQTQKELLLPVTYFMVTFTLPEELRRLARSHQKLFYNLLFRTSAAALQKLALDPRFVGGKIGMVGVLQTWTRDLHYHPHIHYIVPGGGLSEDGKSWCYSKADFLVHEKPLSIIFKAKFRDELQKTELYDKVLAETWSKDWVVDCESVGNGEHALEYVAAYLNRVAISNNRIVEHQGERVIFRYKDSKTQENRTQTIPAEEFIRRFLQHVLPDRFVKVRYYGLLAPKNRGLLQNAKQLLGVESTKEPQSIKKEETVEATTTEKTIPCPICGTLMKWVRQIPRRSRRPP